MQANYRPLHAENYIKANFCTTSAHGCSSVLKIEKGDNMSASAVDCDDFFEATAVPENFEGKKKSIESFIQRHKASDEPIVLVTSGGTTVPLESRTVRFIDNFSIGTRGSASAEYFLDQGYAVIFLHRQRSLLPFHRHIQSNILDHLTVSTAGNDPVITVQSDKTQTLVPTLRRYHDAQSKGRLLLVSFTSLGDYLHLLRETSRALRPLKTQAMLYLAAAVSDFYIPASLMPEHKIQSANGPLQLSLQLVPKMLRPLVKDWTPDAFVVSFKLETDKNILVSKALKALEVYQHKVVVANVLDTRKTEVTLVTQETQEPIRLPEKDAMEGKEIEELIIRRLAELHSQFRNRCNTS